MAVCPMHKAEIMDAFDEVRRRLDVIEGAIKSLINDHNVTSREIMNRVSKLELLIAQAQGMKAGVIASFSLMWAMALAAIAAAWKWMHS